MPKEEIKVIKEESDYDSDYDSIEDRKTKALGLVNFIRDIGIKSLQKKRQGESSFRALLIYVRETKGKEKRQ